MDFATKCCATYKMGAKRTQSQASLHFRILRLLENNPTLTQRQIAEQLDISLGGVNYCLRALIDKGWIKIQNFRSSHNKMGYIYLLTPSGISRKSAMTAQFLKRKLIEYGELTAEIKGLQAELSKELPSEARKLVKIKGKE